MNPILSTVRVTQRNLLRVASRIGERGEALAKHELSVRRIIDDVRSRGDAAVLKYTRKFDGAFLNRGQLLIPAKELETSINRVDKKVLSALQFSLRNLGAAQKSLLSRVSFSRQQNGFKMRLTAKPLSSVGCYIPGGKAVYPSTVLMTAGVAKLVGVSRIVICTPPDARGKVNDILLAAARLCDVNEVYTCGGAQAIAALAYGTETIEKVDKIVGPGGAYVALAKKLVSRDVKIDFFAGPTELIVVADKATDPRLAAWDLIAQAEHGSDGLSCLVTCSEGVAEKVRSEIRRILPQIQRREYVEASMRRGFAAVCSDWETACDFMNEVAPEHLELLTQQARRLADKIQSAGLILIGQDAPAAASDYCIGTDHVLPTARSAKSNGGLSALDFVKPTWTVEGSRNGLRRILRPLEILASAEGLLNHYYSVESRFA